MSKSVVKEIEIIEHARMGNVWASLLPRC